MVRVLISGLLTYDSGKTWLGITLAKRLLSHGVSVGVYKPIAGHNAWSQYSTVVESFKRGVLVGEDVLKYTSILKDVDIELMNPIDILLAPPDPLIYPGINIYSYLYDIENQFGQIVLARISLCLKRVTQHLMFKNNVRRVAPPLRDELEQLSAKLNAIEDSLDSFIQRLRSSDIENELMGCLERIELGRDVILIESFNNAIAPFRRILDDIDVLLVVAPSIVAIYRDDRAIIKAVNEAVNRYGEKGFEAVHLLSRVRPSTTFYIRPRKNIDEYDEAIEQLAKAIISTQ